MKKIIKEQIMILNNKQQILHHVMANQLKILNTTIAYVDKLEEVTSYNAQLLFNITIRINNKMATGLKRGDG